MNELTSEGIRAFKSGDKQKAARLFARAVQQEPDNEAAWYWLSGCVEDVDKKRYCLERVISINPMNERALRKLIRMDEVEPAAEKPAGGKWARNQKRVLAGLSFAVVLVLSSVVWLIYNHSQTANAPDISIVLSVEDVQQASLAPITPSVPPTIVEQVEVQATELVVPVPVTGNPVVISGELGMQTEPFRLLEGKYSVFWQYTGSLAEDSQMEAASDKHRDQVKTLNEAYSACLQENKNLMEWAIDQEDAAGVTAAQAGLAACSQEYEREKSVENERYYREIDAHSTSFSIAIRPSSGSDTITLVAVRGIYYGKTSFVAREETDYSLIVSAGGPWSVTFKPINE